MWGIVAGQVLEISKQGNVAPTPRPGRPAQVYRFPSSKPESDVPATSAVAAPRLSFRMQLAIELGLGMLVWMLWFGWHLMH